MDAKKKRPTLLWGALGYCCFTSEVSNPTRCVLLCGLPRVSSCIRHSRRLSSWIPSRSTCALLRTPLPRRFFVSQFTERKISYLPLPSLRCRREHLAGPPITPSSMESRSRISSILFEGTTLTGDYLPAPPKRVPRVPHLLAEKG